MAVLPAGFAVRRIGQAGAGALIALAAMDNLFDEDPRTAPSGELDPDGARDFLADPRVLFWLADGVRRCGSRPTPTRSVSTANAVSLRTKAKSWSRSFIDWTLQSGPVRV
jgi:hypothetical protein